MMAGCGPDGALVHSLLREGGSRLKARFGRLAYYAHAARLFVVRRWPSFTVEVRLPATADAETMEAVAVMVSRVGDLGGCFRG